MENDKSYLTHLFQDDLLYLVQQERFSLSEDEVSTVADIPAENATKIRAVGRGTNGVLVLYSIPTQEVLSSEYKDFLAKILTACKLVPNDCVFVNAALAQPTDVLPNANKAIVFGNFPIVNQIKYNKLQTHDLTLINNDVEMKKVLWGQLKIYFGI